MLVFGGVTPEMDVADVALWAGPATVSADNFILPGPGAVLASDLD
jgi:hypothetical protein